MMATTGCLVGGIWPAGCAHARVGATRTDLLASRQLLVAFVVFEGHWADNWGVAHHNSWQDGVNRYGGDPHKWILTCSRPTSTWFKISGLDRKRITGGNSMAPTRLHIAWGAHGGEHSDWEFAELAIFNRLLSDSEAEQNFQFYKTRFGIS